VNAIASMLWLLSLGLAQSAVTSAALQRPAVRLDVPVVKQPYNLCLAASVSMVLKYWGIEITPEAIGAQVPVYQGGTTGDEMRRVVEQIGLQGFLIQPAFDDLLLHLEKRRPVIVQLPSGPTGRHAVVLVGIDPSAERMWINDPADGRARALTYAEFRAQWDEARRWTFLIVPK
jgi:ABC-type bacteriocin/lantibiotic exporter with double-glycine peptidase domain